jgi:hypothetical protein
MPMMKASGIVCKIRLPGAFFVVEGDGKETSYGQEADL